MLRLTTSLTTIPHHCDHLSFLPRSLSPSLFLSTLSRSPAPLSCLYLSIYSVLARAFRSSLFVPSAALPPRTAAATPFAPTAPFLARSYASRSYIYLSVSRILCSPFPFFISPARRPVRRLARASIEPAEHRPILHLNLVNLPELANELRAWCLILAHEHGRRYTASNASGEGTRVQSSPKVLSLMIARCNHRDWFRHHLKSDMLCLKYCTISRLSSRQLVYIYVYIYI